MRFIFTLFFVLCTTVGCRANANLDIIETGSLSEQFINIAGIDRRYHLFLPEQPANAGIVLLIHGFGGSSEQLLGLNGVKAPYKQWLGIAERENLILAVPNGSVGPSNKQGWNDCRADLEDKPSSNDVLFVTELIDYISVTYSANASETFAVGTSNGGHMVLRLAQEIPEKLAAIASIVAANPKQSDCTNSTEPISVLIMNGTHDPLLPFDGGQIASNRGEVFSTEATVAYWVERNQTESIPTLINLPDIDVNDDSTLLKQSYQNGINNAEVVLYTVVNGGHTEPSMVERYSAIYKRIVGNQNGDIEMAEEIWAFFRARLGE